VKWVLAGIALALFSGAMYALDGGNRPAGIGLLLLSLPFSLLADEAHLRDYYDKHYGRYLDRY